MTEFWIDTETTGSLTSKDSIVQLALVVRVDGKETESHNWRIKPYKKKTMDPGATAANHITQEMADSYPDQELAFDEFRQILRRYRDEAGERIYFCGYNSQSFDLQIVKEWFEYNDRKDLWEYIMSPATDVMLMAEPIFKFSGIRQMMPNFKLPTVYRTIFNEDFDDAHDAMADIRATLRIYDVIVEKYFPETWEKWHS